VVSCAISRAGPMGGIIALLLWNLPGLVVLTICGVLIESFVDPENPPWYLIGLPPAAVALVFTAFYKFAQNVDRLGTILALFTALAAILINNDADISPQSSQYVFPSALAISGAISWLDSKRKTPFGTYPSPPGGGDAETAELMKRIGIPLWAGCCIFLVYFAVLTASILIVVLGDSTNVYLDIFETMFRVGSIIFGGGQVVLPLLQDEVVPNWMTKDQFLQGLGLAQSMPGPLFNISGYLGAVYQGVPGALVAFIGLFGPGVILIFAVAPFWVLLRRNVTFRNILRGVNASGIGLIGAACVTLWESAIGTSADAMVFCISLTMSAAFQFDAPYCILIGGIVGAILHPDALNLGQQPYCIKAGYVDAA
jgi:chromate transporter